MKYDVRQPDADHLLFTFRFTKEDLKDGGLKEAAGKAYAKAAMDYPEEIYYSPVMSVVNDGPKPVCTALVQIRPTFTLGNYKGISLTENDLRSAEEKMATVPAEHRKSMRRYYLQNIFINRLSEMAEGEIPDTMAGERAASMMSAFEHQLENNGQKIEDYYKECDTNEAELFAGFAEEAVKQLHTRLALYELAKAEKLLATDADYEAELKRLSEQSLMSVGRLRELFARKEESKVRQDIAIAKAAEYFGRKVDTEYPCV